MPIEASAERFVKIFLRDRLDATNESVRNRFGTGEPQGDNWYRYSYTPKVKWVRVLLYPYWPPGEYFVDNVRLVEYDPKIHGQTAAGR